MLSLALALVLQVQTPPKVTPPPPPDPSKVLATVNSTPIYAKDVAPYLWDARAYGITQLLINRALVKNEATKLHVSVTEAEITKDVQDKLELFKRQIPAGTPLEQALHERGFSTALVRVAEESELLLQKVIAQSFSPDQYVRVSTFAIPVASTSTTDLTAAIKSADDAYARLKKGEAWEKVLASVSKDPRMAQSGGALGWVEVKNFPPAVGKELPTLKVKDVTKPVQTANGFQIFRVDQFGKDAKGPDLENLRAQYTASAREPIMKKLKDQAKVEMFFDK